MDSLCERCQVLWLIILSENLIQGNMRSSFRKKSKEGWGIAGSKYAADWDNEELL
jgi:hypothetical protein